MVARDGMRSDRALGFATTCMLATLVISPELLGGVFPWAIAATCLLTAGTGLTTAIGVPVRGEGNPNASVLDWAMIAALVWTCLQLVPLPKEVVALFVPESVEAWSSTARLYGESVRSWVPMSLDPGATRLEVAKGTAIVGVFLSARLFATHDRRRHVLAAVGLSSMALALVAFGHALADADRVFGLYEPVYASSRLLAPIMNENHLGGFMVMTCPVLVGLAVDADTSERRAVWAIGALLAATACVLSFSRGAIGALLVGLVAFSAMAFFKLDRNRRSALRSKALPIATVAALAVVFIVVALQGTSLARELGYRHNVAGKFEGAAKALPLIASHPVAGVGRGAFSAAFVDQHGTEKRFFYPENLLVQWTSEWGIPVALLVLGTVIWSLARGFRASRSSARLGGVAGLIGVGLQQLADFSLELCGVVVVAAATLGAVADSPKVRFPPSLRTLCLLGSVASATGVALALTMHGGDVVSLEQGIRNALESERHEETKSLVDRGLMLHPSEPIFALSGAELAVREGDPTAGLWLNLAQSLAPLWSAPHLLAARWLFSIQRGDQALLELREAESLQPGSARDTICTLLRREGDPAIALRTAPRGPEGIRLLDRSAQCVPIGSPVAIAIDEHARELDPAAIGPATRQARRLLASNRPEEAAELLSSLPGLDVGATKVLAEAHLRSRNLSAAVDTVTPLLEQARLPADVLKTTARVYASAGDDEKLSTVASRLRALTAGKPQALAEVELFMGKLYESHERHALALRSYQASVDAKETREGLEAVAKSADVVGDRRRALFAYQRICQLDGGRGPACASAAERGKPTAIVP